jgi:hypothetical protein
VTFAPGASKSNVKKEATATAISSIVDKKNSIKQKLFLCSECNEHYPKLRLFDHMKNVHNKFTCLYCYGFFVKIEDLEKHLVKKHKVQNSLFSDEQTLRNFFNRPHDTDTNNLSKVIKAVCCKCASVLTLNNKDFNSHSCGIGDVKGSNSSAATPLQSVKSVNENNNNSTTNNNTNLAVQNHFVNNNSNNNSNQASISSSSSATAAAVAASSFSDTAKENLYFDQAINQWLQPSANPNKTTYNGGKVIHTLERFIT